MQKTLVVLTGPTGVGKTELSIEIAGHFGTVIVSADSRQVYREMKIGTAVPSEQQLSRAPHYFIGNKSIHDYYNASRYENEVIELLGDLFTANDIVILAGGSMLYIDAVCKGIDDLPEIDPQLRSQLLAKIENEGIEGLRFELKRLDPEYYAIVDLKNRNRILRAVEVCILSGRPYSSFRKQTLKKRDFGIVRISLDRERKELYNRINKRVDEMMNQGLLSEAGSLYPYRDLNALKTVGYRELFGYFEGKYPLEKAVELIKNNTRNYARRQLTWFRKDKDVVWHHADDIGGIMRYLNQVSGS